MASSAAERASGMIGGFVSGGSRSKLSLGVDSHDEERASGEESGEGGGSGSTGVNEAVAAAVVAGEEEDDPSGLSTTTAGSVRECGRLLEGLVSSGSPYIVIGGGSVDGRG